MRSIHANYSNAADSERF